MASVTVPRPSGSPRSATADALRSRALGLADRFLPPELAGPDAPPDDARRTRVGILIGWLGVVCTVSSAILYAYLGSAWSAAAIGTIAVALSVVHLGVRRGMSLLVIGNAVTALTWLATFVVGARTGGFSSPAVVWCFFHPLTTYVACGRRSATIWSALSAVQIAVFYMAERLGFAYQQDISAEAASLLRMGGFIGCILTNVALMAAIEGVRAASQEAMDTANRTLERQRILGDMHDGVGSQLMGLMIQVRAKRIDNDRLIQGLSSCLDDLKLIVDSLDPTERSFDVAIAELRMRLEPRCDAADIELNWNMEADPPRLGAEQTLQVLRALQEMTSNAQRHAHTPRIDVCLQRLPDRPGIYEVTVRDHGVGFDPGAPPRVGRGLTSLQSRAQRLGGTVTVEPGAPGTRVALRFPA